MTTRFANGLLIQKIFRCIPGLLVLAALISNSAGSLACGLAGGLALAATTLLDGVLQLFGI